MSDVEELRKELERLINKYGEETFARAIVDGPHQPKTPKVPVKEGRGAPPFRRDRNALLFAICLALQFDKERRIADVARWTDQHIDLQLVQTRGAKTWRHPGPNEEGVRRALYDARRLFSVESDEDFILAIARMLNALVRWRHSVNPKWGFSMSLGGQHPLNIQCAFQGDIARLLGGIDAVVQEFPALQSSIPEIDIPGG